MAIINAQYQLDDSDENLAKLSERLKDLIRCLLVPDPRERYTLE